MGIDKTDVLKRVKLVTGEENDEFIYEMIDDAEASILAYCNILLVPAELSNALKNLAIFKYRMIGSENLSGESGKFGGSSYLTDIPEPIKRELNRYRVVRIR